MYTFLTRPHCPICHADDRQNSTLFERPLTDNTLVNYLSAYYSGRVPTVQLADGRYIVRECRTCGSLYQQQILDNAGMDALYETWIDPDASRHKKEHAPLAVRVGYARQVQQFIRAADRPPHQIQLLDFGMGWASWLLMAKAFGMQVTGVEVSPSRVAYAQGHGVAVASHTDIAPASVDAINAEQVFEHLADPRTVLESCHTWLKHGGVIRIAVPNGKTIADRIRKGAWQVSDMETIPLEHINTFTPHSLRGMLSSVGFRVFVPPLVMPSLSPTRADFKQWLGVLGRAIVERSGFWQDTIVWARKV